jgi:flagellar biosynthesis/type III secretory pathway chaperone
MAVILAEQLNRRISLLEELHILAQTESLALDARDWAKLEVAVSAKESLVVQINETEKQIAAISSGASPSALESLERRTAQLVDLIRQVDDANRIRLENLKAASMQAAQVLSERQKLQAYRSADTHPSSFSKFVE